jgi:hypothetical protein
MNRILTVFVAVLLAFPVVACAASSAPEQKEGTGKFEKHMTQAEAQKLMEDLNQAGPVCRRAVPDCSYGSPDENGIVVFEALINCGALDGCSLLILETCS